MGVCGTDHYLHGSDYPFIPFKQSLEWCDALDAGQRAAVLGGNAKRLFGL